MSALKNRDKMVTKVLDEEHFKSFFNEANKKLVVVDLHPQWAGPCEVMYTLFMQLAASIDDFKNRVDVLAVDV
jgi:thioredoxin 1